MSLPLSALFPTATQALITPVRNTAASLLNPATVPPRSLMAQFDWISQYGGGSAQPDVNVLVGMQAGGAQLPIDVIRSVKIDNLGNPSAVYVYFLDTTDTIVAPPDTVVWEPVVTNSRFANVICTGLVDGIVAQTKVYFCNFFVPPYINAEINNVAPNLLASPNGGGILGTSIQQLNLLSQGSGLAVVPTIAIGAPAIGGTQATATCSATVIGTPTVINNGGSNVLVGNFIPFANGISLKVATIGTGSHGAGAPVVTFEPIQNGGSIGGNLVAGACPAQLTSIDGKGITAGLTWGINPATLALANVGAGYLTTPAVTFSSGNASAVAVLAPFPASASVRANYAIPALGDLEKKINAALSVSGTSTPLIAATANLIYPTAFYLQAYNCTSAAHITVQILDSDGLVYWEADFWGSGLNIPIFQGTGFNFRWPGNKGFSVKTTGVDATGHLVVKVAYTNNPR